MFIFSIFINDLQQIIVSEYHSYADKKEIIRAVDYKRQLEKNKEIFILWSKDDRLNFNFCSFKNVQFALPKQENKQFLLLSTNETI